MAECVPTSEDAGLFDGGKGAFVNVVGIASSKESFAKNVAEKLKELSARIVCLEDVEPFEERASKWVIDDEIRDAAASLDGNGDVALATLDIYLDTEA